MNTNTINSNDKIFIEFLGREREYSESCKFQSIMVMPKSEDEILSNLANYTLKKFNLKTGQVHHLHPSDKTFYAKKHQ